MEDLSLLQILILSVIQAITEFLPISSSAHLLLPSKLLGWSDQGLFFDVVVHFASLLAVLTYFWKDLIDPKFYFSRLFQFIVLATIPLVLATVFIDEIGSIRWSIETIAVANIVFALLLYISTKSGNNYKQLNEMKFTEALGIGIWQIFSVISGASRSGTAITGALFFGFKREDAARFAVLLSIPTILGALVYIISQNQILIEDRNILATFIAFLTTFTISYICIGWFISFVKRVGYLPFVLYRLILGIILLCLI